MSTAPSSSSRGEQRTLRVAASLAAAVLLGALTALVYAMSGSWRAVGHIGAAAVLLPLAAFLLRWGLRRAGRPLPVWSAVALGAVIGLGAGLLAGFDFSATAQSPGAATFGIGGALVFQGVFNARSAAG